VLTDDRAEAWKLRQFHDYVRGRCFPWWLPHPAAIWAPVTFTTGYVDIEVAGNLADLQDFVDYVALVKTDGTVEIRAVSSITLVSGNWRVAVSSSFSAYAAADVVRFVPAYLVRFREDALVEEWVTDSVCRFQVSAIEVLESEQDAELATVTVNPG
jgi:hypothetical protein